MTWTTAKERRFPIIFFLKLLNSSESMKKQLLENPTIVTPLLFHW